MGVEDEYGVPQIDKPENAGSFFYKLIFGALLFATYFFVQRFSASLGAGAARRATEADRRNYDEEMREARRRLQERFDVERKKREEMKKEDKPSTSGSNDQKPQTETQNQTKRIKPPNPELLKGSGEYFPLMGNTGGNSRSKVSAMSAMLPVYLKIIKLCVFALMRRLLDAFSLKIEENKSSMTSLADSTLGKCSNA
ncbi:hypothetical protein ACTXT7_002697 [Hymenolepis weldensis]